MKTDLLELMELEVDDPEMVPEILPANARMSIRGSVAKLIPLFERAANVTPAKEVIHGTGYALFEAIDPTLDALSYVRVTATDGQMSIAVVDDSIYVNRAGAVLVPGKKISEILKKCPEDEVRITVLGNTATILSGRVQWTVQTPVGDSLPQVADIDSIPVEAVLREPFLSALIVARRAIPSGGRPSLAQGSIHAGHITTSDSSRIHRQTIEGWPSKLDLDIPKRVMDELIQALKGSDEELVSVGGNDYHLVFVLGQDTIIANRLLVNFPEMEALILGPAFSNQNTLTVNTRELEQAISRVRINSDPDYSGIFLCTIPGKKNAEGEIMWQLSVRTRDQIGNASQEIIDCSWAGTVKARELCLNHHYLSDLLSGYDSEFVTFKVGDDTKTVRNPLFLEDTTTGFTGILQQMNPNYIR